jgi:putative transposase
MAKRYSTDLTDAQWAMIEDTFCIMSDRGRPREVDMREIVNAIFYISKTGCHWGLLPKDFPPKSTVYYYFKKFTGDGTFVEANRILRESVRVKAGRDKQPTAGIIDSQSSKGTSITKNTGFDGGKKINGRKRHIVTDALGMLLICLVHAANISDQSGAKLLLPTLFGWFSNIKMIFADGGYTGSPLRDWVMSCFNWVLKIIKRPRKKFQVVKFRWVVERTFAWLLTHRRLSKSYEIYTKTEESWVYIAASQIALKRVCPG